MTVYFLDLIGRQTSERLTNFDFKKLSDLFRSLTNTEVKIDASETGNLSVEVAGQGHTLK